MTDEQIIERCKAAGIKWIPPHDDEDDSGAFPGSFDMVSMAEMRALLAAPSAVDAARACEVCDGVGTIGTPGQRCFGCEGYGRTVAGAPSVADADIEAAKRFLPVFEDRFKELTGKDFGAPSVADAAEASEDARLYKAIQAILWKYVPVSHYDEALAELADAIAKESGND